MIHCVDLSTIIKYLVFEKPVDHDYIHAIDFAPNKSQAKLIKTISEAMGGQDILQQTHLDSIFNEDYNIITLNINLIPNDLLTTVDVGEKDPYKQQTYAEGEKKTYKWKYRSGFAENFDAIYNEYKLYRNLKTIKLGVFGPSTVPGSLYGEDISKKLRIPFISYDSLIAEVLKKEDELGKETRKYLENEKSRMVREATEELEKLKAKKKKGIPDSINPDDYVPKLNLEMINKIFSMRLNKSDCRNKGYVLENYPTTREEASLLFVQKIPIKNEVIETIGGDKDEVNPVSPGRAATSPSPQEFQLIPRTEIMPDKVVGFIGENSLDIMTHLKQVIGEEKVEEMGVTQEIIDQKFNEWTQKQTPEINSISDFYKEYKIEIYPVNFKNYETKGKVMDYIGEKIEFTLKEPSVDEEHSLEQGLDNSMEDKQIPGQEEQNQVNQNQNDETINAALEEIKQQEQEILNQKSQALKQYITDNLLPSLTSGLIDICNNKPEDPLDYLADYLINMSQKKSTTVPKDN